MPRLHIYKNEKETFAAVADWLVELIKDAAAEKDRFTIAVSIDQTSLQLFKILSTDYKDKIDWSKLHLFLGDAGFVSYESDNSDSKIGRKVLDILPLPKDHMHFISTDVSPEDAAREYEAVLHSYFDNHDNTFDLVILSLDQQGKTLSLYPGNEANTESIAWVIPVYNKEEDVYRITLTSPVINEASVKVFIVTGKNKQDVVQQVLKGKYEPEKFPAQLIQTVNKTVHWFLDEAASVKLLKPNV